MLERDYQRRLIAVLKDMFPGCFILKNDSSYLPGVPDLTILYRRTWACLEVKTSLHATRQPNQAYYVDELHKMSYSAFIYPENEGAVLDDLQRVFARPQRRARVSQS